MLIRIAVSSVLCAAVLLALPSTAFADTGNGGGNNGLWGSVECDQDPSPGCSLGAGSGVSAPSPGAPASGNTGADGGGSGAVADPNPNPVQCSYVRSDFQAPPSSGSTTLPAVASDRPLNVVAADAAPSPPRGAWYVYECTGNGERDGVYRDPVWIADADTAAPGLLAAALAAQARNELALPGPTIELSPTGDQLVNLPSWLWLLPASWGARSATAAVPGVSVTATATPESVSWSMGDGATVTCDGPGTAYTAGDDPASASPTCGHTYRTSSAGQPGAAFAVTATVHWSVAWAGAGQGGVFPDLTTTVTVPVPVAESQALTTH